MNNLSRETERLVRLTPDDHDKFAVICAIYRQAIPANERKTNAELQALLQRADYAVYSLEQNRQVLAFAILYRSLHSNCALLEYMAVDQRYRNAGIGSRILSQLWTPKILGPDGSVCLVEVDAPGPQHADSAIRRRRQDFYRRNGCRLIRDLAYILPLPNSGQTAADMQLMAFFCGAAYPVSRQTLSAWLKDIYVHVYGCQPEDSRILQMMQRLPDYPVFA